METYKTTQKQLDAIAEKIIRRVVNSLIFVDGTFDKTFTIKTTFQPPLREIEISVSGTIEPYTEGYPPTPSINCNIYLDPIVVEKDGKQMRLEIDTERLTKAITNELTQ